MRLTFTNRTNCCLENVISLLPVQRWKVFFNDRYILVIYNMYKLWLRAFCTCDVWLPWAIYVANMGYHKWVSPLLLDDIIVHLCIHCETNDVIIIIYWWYIIYRTDFVILSLYINPWVPFVRAPLNKCRLIWIQAWIKIKSSIIKCAIDLQIHSQIETLQPLKYGND